MIYDWSDKGCAATIRTIRRDLGASQAKLAALLGMGKHGGRRIRYFEAGQAHPSRARCNQLEKLHRKTVSQIEGGK